MVESSGSVVLARVILCLFILKVSLSFSRSILTDPPFANSPNSTFLLNGDYTSVSITRCNGLAPILGLYPLSANQFSAESVRFK